VKWFPVAGSRYEKSSDQGACSHTPFK